jgi:hypothetical protein
MLKPYYSLEIPNLSVDLKVNSRLWSPLDLEKSTKNQLLLSSATMYLVPSSVTDAFLCTIWKFHQHAKPRDDIIVRRRVHGEKE